MHALMRSVCLIGPAGIEATLTDGKTRVEAGKMAGRNLTGLPDTRLVFPAYGHSHPRRRKDCKDASLLRLFYSLGAKAAERSVRG